MTLGELADQLQAALVGVHAQEQDESARPVTGVAGIETAGPTEVSFVANPKYAALARSSKAAALIVEPEFPAVGVPTLRLQNPKLAFSRAVALFHPLPAVRPGIHPTAVVAETALIGARPHLGPFAVVGERCHLGDDAVLLAHSVLYDDVTIGDRFFAHAHAVVREGCRLGNDVTIGNGAVIGSDGFGFAREASGRWLRTVHPGPAILEDEVEIQANSCIDRSIVGETRIGRGSKIDNLVQVGHASTVGENTLLCAQVGLAGSTRIGRGVILAGQVGVAGHLTVGDGAIATAQTGIPSDVAPGAVVSGYPAMDNRAWLRTVAALQRLPELLRRLRMEKSR
ncbi:MAG: UDP-3-O-(3-hydroxymyristoyl)glucosamine N-acyltransferase [Janthinobacterium lividum]